MYLLTPSGAIVQAFENDRENIRHNHEQLLISITGELWFGVETLLPCLFDDICTCVGLTFVVCTDFVELNLLIDQALKCWLNVIAVIMGMIMTMVTLSVTRVIVPVVVRHGGAW